jgi:hypothetical protein
MPRKDNRTVSKISTKAECYVCRHFFNAETLYPLEKHHFLSGRGIRKLADEDGLFAYVCSRHHREIHDHGKFEKELKHIAQETFVKEKRKEGYPEDAAREMFKERYGRFYP